MRSERPWRRGVRIEMLPLIDVVFLLLVAFMYSVVTLVRSTAIPVTLPRMESVEDERFSAVLVVSVTSAGALFAGGDPVDAHELVDRLEGLRQKDPQLSVLVNADADARHADVARTLDALRAAGQERVLLAGVSHAGETH